MIILSNIQEDRTTLVDFSLKNLGLIKVFEHRILSEGLMNLYLQEFVINIQFPDGTIILEL